jgi:hypothetical protein
MYGDFEERCPMCQQWTNWSEMTEVHHRDVRNKPERNLDNRVGQDVCLDCLYGSTTQWKHRQLPKWNWEYEADDYIGYGIKRPGKARESDPIGTAGPDPVGFRRDEPALGVGPANPKEQSDYEDSGTGLDTLGCPDY